MGLPMCMQARKAVVSNASLWDTLPLLPPADRPPQMVQHADDTPLNRSFMHLHVCPHLPGAAWVAAVSVLACSGC